VCAKNPGELYGSGGGSIAPQAIVQAFPLVWALSIGGKLRIDTEPVRLAAWKMPGNGEILMGRRLVIVP
jgi:hypothetical protein